MLNIFFKMFAIYILILMNVFLVPKAGNPTGRVADSTGAARPPHHTMIKCFHASWLLFVFNDGVGRAL